MTSGLLFYWFSWLVWVFVTFIMKPGMNRTFIAVWILLTISGSSFELFVLGYSFSTSYLFLITGAMILLTKTSRTFYLLFSSLTVMVLYMAVLLWENYYPIWMITKTFLSPMIIVLIIIFLSKSFYNRISVALLGVSSGELVYGFILSSYSITDRIGGFVFLDSVMIIIFLFAGIETAKLLRVKCNIIFLTYKKSLQLLSEE